MEDVNRTKLVLVEKKRTNKWLAEQLGVNPSTVMRVRRQIEIKKNKKKTQYDL